MFARYFKGRENKIFKQVIINPDREMGRPNSVATNSLNTKKRLIVISISIISIAILSSVGYFSYEQYNKRLKEVNYLKNQVLLANDYIDRLNEYSNDLNNIVKNKEEIINEKTKQISDLQSQVNLKNNEVNAKEELIKQQQAEKNRVDEENRQIKIDLAVANVQGCVLANRTSPYYNCVSGSSKISCFSSGSHTYTHRCLYLGLSFTCSATATSVYNCKLNY